MSNRGRPRKPTALKVIEGTARPDRENKAEPKLEVAALAPPDHLSPLARSAWADACAILVQMRVVTIADPLALESLCEAYAESRELRAQIAREGRVYEADRGDGSRMLRANPAVAMLADSERRLLTLLSKFGMTPADRSRVQAAPEDDAASPWAAYA